MYPVSSSIQKYKAQKDIRRADSSNLATKEKYKLLNTSIPGNQTLDRSQNLSPSQKSSNTRTSMNYQNIIQQLQPSTTKASSKPSSSSSSSKNSYQAKKNDLLKQYLKNTIGTKKSSSKVLPDNWQDTTAQDRHENKENRDISNVKIQLDTTTDASYNHLKYQSKVEAYLMNVKSGRPQSANKNPGKTNLINAFLSPKNNPQFQNQLSRNSKGNLVGTKDLNIVNNTTIRYQPDSRDISFVEPGARGKSTEPTGLLLDESRRPSGNTTNNNKILLDLDESLHFSPQKQQRPMTVTNSRAKEDFKNILNPNVATTKNGDDRSKNKYFKFRDMSNEGFDLEFSPVPKKRDGNMTCDNLNSSAVNIKDSLNRISKNLANQPYPTLIKQINLASNTPTGNAKPPLYNLPLDSQTPSNKPAVSEKRAAADYYPINKPLNIPQTTKENKKIEFPTYLQNYTCDRSKSKKDISFNLEPYNHDSRKDQSSAKTITTISSNPNIEVPTQKKSRSSSEHHQDILEVINRRLANESPKISDNNKENTNQLNTQNVRYSTGATTFQDLLPSKTPKNGSFGENQMRNLIAQANAYTPSNNIGKQIDCSIKKITDLFTNPNQVSPRKEANTPKADKILTIDIKDYREYNKEKENREADVLREKNANNDQNTNPNVELKRPAANDEKVDLSNKENLRDVHILDLDSGTRDTKMRQFKEEYLIGKQIGQGAYACVRLAIHKPSNKKIAIKIYDKAKIMEPMRRKSVKREIKLMQRMDHPNIVKIYDTFETGHHVNIIMEYVGGMSLHGYLKSQPNRRLKEENAFKIFKQVVNGINYCHTRCISHRDIKLENILLDHNGNVKLIDFGFSTCIPNDKKVKMFCGTPSYMAPEIVLKKEYAGPPADVWALGVLLFALLCGAFPFKGENDKDLYRRIVKAEFIIPEFVSDNAASLIRRMVTFDCDRRPSAKEIMNDPWYLMHSFLEKKAEQSASSLGSHRKSLSIEKVSTEATDPRSNTSQNLAVINLKPETPVAQVNNYMKPPTSGNTPTNAHSKINFNAFKNEIANKQTGGVRASSPKNADGSFLNMTSDYISNKTVIYGLKNSTNKTDNDTMIFEDPEDDAKRINAYKKSLNETEIWGNIITQSTEKPYNNNKRDYSNPRGSSLGNNNIYNLSTNSASKDRHMAPILTGNLTPSSQVSHYDIEVINNMYKMGYKEDEINQGLKDKTTLVFSVYNRLVNEKKASMNSNNMILAALAQNSNNPASFISPTHMIMKKRGFDFGNAGYGKNSMLDISGINRDNSMLNTSEYQRNSFNGMRDVNVSNTDIVIKYAGN